MRKYVVGFLVGVLLTCSFTAYAEEVYEIMGKQVDGVLPLKINGERASKDVAVIEGSSYLPVRVAGELFGFKVDFQNGEVMLNTPSALDSLIEEKEARLGRLNESLQRFDDSVEEQKKRRPDADYDARRADLVKDIEDAKAEIAMLKKIKAESEAKQTDAAPIQ